MSLMEQMNVGDEQKISFDFSRFRLPQYVGEFRPLLYKQGDRFCAVLGPDPQSGIFGCGDTPEDALINWNDELRENLRHPDLKNPVIQFVLDTISAKAKTYGDYHWTPPFFLN